MMSDQFFYGLKYVYSLLKGVGWSGGKSIVLELYGLGLNFKFIIYQLCK